MGAAPGSMDPELRVFIDRVIVPALVQRLLGEKIRANRYTQGAQFAPQISAEPASDIAAGTVGHSQSIDVEAYRA
jgi:hypothetical protein